MLTLINYHTNAGLWTQIHTGRGRLKMQDLKMKHQMTGMKMQDLKMPRRLVHFQVLHFLVLHFQRPLWSVAVIRRSS